MFDSIWFDGREVRLKYDEASRNAVTSSTFKCKEPPTPAFRAALQAFTGFALQTVDLPDSWVDADVRQVKLKEEKKGVRGIVVTIMRKCKNAKNRPVTINTPYMSQKPGNTEGGEEIGGWLTEATLAMMEEIESQAKKYHDGERGEQIPMAIDDTNTSNFAKRAAAAETGSTRRPKGRKGGADIVPMGEAIRQMLLKCSRDVPVEAIDQWTNDERAEVVAWAEAKIAQLASGDLGDASRPLKEPKIVKASATLPLHPEKE